MSDSETNSLKELLVTSARDLRLGPTAAERAEAAQKLGHSRSRVAVSFLIDALNDAAVEVRLAVIEALSEIRDATAIAPLESLLDRENISAGEKAKIAAAIGEIKTGVSGPASDRTSPRLENIALQTAAGVSAAEERQRLEDVYRRAAEERQLIEAARRKSTEQARRRAEEEGLRLKAEEDGVARLTKELTHRREEFEKARTAAEAEAQKLKELEEQV